MEKNEENIYKNIPCSKCRIEWRCQYKTMYHVAFVEAVVMETAIPECPWVEEQRTTEKGVYNNG